jgi:hypothetical protein
MTRTRCFPAFLVTLLAVSLCSSAEAQFGGLVKKVIGKQAPNPPATGPAVAFDSVVLELTPARIAKVIAGKHAARQIADGPNGPAALERRLEPLDARQTQIYEKHVTEINALEEKRQDIERCRDSAMSALADRKLATSSQADQQRMMQVGIAVATANARGDTAEARRLTDQLQRSRQPSAADSAAARQQCGSAPTPAIVQEWLDLKAQIEKLQQQIVAANQAISDAEENTSGMNPRQMAVACERIELFLDRQKAKQQQVSLSTAEISALSQAGKDLEDVCQ